MGERSGVTRATRLEQALEALRRRFGEWIIYRLREARPAVGALAVSTGSLGLDLATGIGGVPRGRLTELCGPPTSGKSTLAFHVLANAQRERGFVALVDAGHTADLGQLRRCGVDLEDLLLAVPESAREALDIACLLAASEGLDALVIAGANALVLGPFGDRRAFALGLGRLVVELADNATALVVVVDQDGAWRAAGGSAARALAHAATLRIVCRPLGLVTHASGEVLGVRLRAEVAKNRLAAAQRAAEVEVRRDGGVHAATELFTLGLADGLVRSGPDALGYCFGDTWLGRGRQAAVRALDAEPELRAALRAALVGRP
jgi:recombination protein RecA